MSRSLTMNTFLNITDILKKAFLLTFLLYISGTAQTYSKEKNKKSNSNQVIKHVIVYKEGGKFCGWPANHGIWIWGDEILVGFELGYYKESTNKHSFDRDKLKILVTARSLDGGESWMLEKPEGIIPPSLGGRKPIQCPGNINFKHPDFAMKLNSARFIISYDRGKKWQGPFEIPKFNDRKMWSRTDYIVDNEKEGLFFSTSPKSDGKEGRPFAAYFGDSGKIFNFLSWIGPEPNYPGYSIMPSTVRITESQIVSAIRNYKRGDVNQGWIDIYVSNNNGNSWEFLRKLAETGDHGGNPPSMIKLKDGRLCVVYGNRTVPSGIYAKLSSDNGQSWGDEIILRQDGKTWDIGYCRTVQRSDGKIVCVYYYITDENPEQHIAATIWDPNRVENGSDKIK